MTINEKADYVAFLRLRGLAPEDDSHALRASWARSAKRGRFCDLLDKRRRREFGPGKYYAASPAGVFLNRSVVKGWRGVNPRLP